MDSEAGLTFRSATPEDMPFLHNSWGSSYYTGSRARQYLTPDEFHSYHRPIRNRFLTHPQSQITICSPDFDPWLIMGWIGVERIPSAVILQYLYVKDAFKQQGIATMLVKRAITSSPVLYTHLTEKAAGIIAKHHDQFLSFKHVPHLV